LFYILALVCVGLFNATVSAVSLV